jgi:hypothetical protein
VTVTVVRGHEPASARVIFHDDSGIPQGTPFVTDANGVVSQPRAPKQLTVILRGDPGQPTAVELVTYIGVEEGDRLVVDASNYQFDPGQNELTPLSYEVGLPGEQSGATFYTAAIDRGCSDGITIGDGAELDVSSACLRPSNAILGAAGNGGNPPLAFAWKKGVVPPTGVKTPVTLDAWAAPTDLTVTVTNPPTASDYRIRGEATAVAGSQSFVQPHTNDEASVFTYKMPPAGFADGYQASFTQEHPTQESYGVRALVQRAAPAAAMSLDYATLLPKMTASTIDLADANRPLVSWTTERPFANADAADIGAVRFEWYTRVNADTQGYHSWTIIVPGNATNARAPQLTADELEEAPGRAIQGEVFLSGIVFGESSLAATYKDAKRVPVPSHRWHFGDIGIPLPAAGTLRATALGVWLGMIPPG